MNYLILFIVAALFYYFFLSGYIKIESFANSQDIIIKTLDNQYAMVCANQFLCLTDKDKDKSVFTVQTFDKTSKIIALSNEGLFIAACFGDKCDDTIKVNNHNPYGVNAKLTLEQNSDGTYNIQFYDGKYMCLGKTDKKRIEKAFDKSKALKVYLEEYK